MWMSEWVRMYLCVRERSMSWLNKVDIFWFWYPADKRFGIVCFGLVVSLLFDYNYNPDHQNTDTVSQQMILVKTEYLLI